VYEKAGKPLTAREAETDEQKIRKGAGQ